MGKVVGLTYDLRDEYVFKEEDPPDANAEFDHPETVDAIEKALTNRGHEVIRIGNVYNLLKRLDELKVDIVFNIAEGLYGRNRESQVPIILELKNIPFVGSDGLTLGLTLDKALTKKIFLAEKIPTPRFLEISNPKELKEVNLRFPLIVKPRYEGSSKGLSYDSVVRDTKALYKKVNFIIEKYKQPVLVEEFIKGKEFTVVVMGNAHPQSLPPVQISINGKLDLGEEFFAFEYIRSHNLKYLCPANISKKLEKELKDLAVKVYKVVECKDFGRVDFRVDKKGKPYVLEINPLPSLSLEDVFPIVAKQIGLSYKEIINKILNYALERHGIL